MIQCKSFLAIDVTFMTYFSLTLLGTERPQKRITEEISVNSKCAITNWVKFPLPVPKAKT